MTTMDETPREHTTFQDNSIEQEHNDSSGTEGKIPGVEDFVFIKPISRGAFGKVFLGHKRGRPDKLYAIKVMKKADMVNKNLTNQVITERDAMVKSAGPFVVQLYYSIQSQQNIFLVMEYLIGGDVKSLLAVVGYFEEPMAILYVAEVTLALEYLHSKGIIHRDLKPDNMLVTAEGHIKLTDFGLSKFNINFNPHDIPRSPKTPMPYSQNFYHHTPGQILSLHSNFAFTTRKHHSSVAPTTPSSRQFKGHPINSPMESPGHLHSPLSEISPNITPCRAGKTDSIVGTPNIPRSRHSRQASRPMRDMVLTKSTSQFVDHPVATSSPGLRDSLQSVNEAPVKRLLSTLQDSLNWTESSGSGYQGVDLSDCPRERGSPELKNEDVTRSVSVCDQVHASGNSGDTGMGKATDRYRSSVLSDNVFDMAECANMEVHVSCDIKQDNCGIGEDKMATGNTKDANDSVFETNQQNCSNVVADGDACDECGSHLKVPSKQEKLTDETPQMHRSNESVKNSYAAKNLRSLRDGSFSEGSPLHTGRNKENVLPHVILNESDRKALCEVKPKSSRRRLTKAKSFSYMSNEDAFFGLNCDVGDSETGPSRRKRGFCDVEQSPVRRTHSAESGLTRELSLLKFSHVEPHSKRSNSIPRTRIRFHSGQSVLERDTFPSDCDDRKTCEAKKCLTRTSMVFSDKIETKGIADLDVKSENKTKDAAAAGDKVNDDAGHRVNDNIHEASKTQDCVSMSHPALSGLACQNTAHDSVASPEIVFTAVADPIAGKRVQQLQRTMISSLKSEGDTSVLGINLSSIHPDDGEVTPLATDHKITVFDSKENIVPEEESNRCVSPLLMLPDDLSMPKPLLPPPPPKPRRLSGSKLSPTSGLRVPAAHGLHPPQVLGNKAGYQHRTPEPPDRQKIFFCTPNIPFSRTPRTQQNAANRSHSFCYSAKTPYRTPKSVRRAPAPVDEERILGTPDYLAPEILLQKPHDAAVDWWSLGVCMFEFLTGIPPFNDQTPDLVFENILNRDIPWPVDDEALSGDCKDAIDALLTLDKDKRPKAREVRRMAAFRNIDWHHVLDMKPPFIPEPDDQTDTSYFEARNQAQDLFVSDVDF